jgi:arsenate reductase (glutaredoxin)
MKLYHNPRCSKSRKAKQFLEEKNISFQTILYLEQPLTQKEIKELLSKGLKLRDLLREKEPEYKEHIKGNELTEKKIIELLIAHPKILQRPIIVTSTKAFVARDEESLKKAIL